MKVLKNGQMKRKSSMNAASQTARIPYKNPSIHTTSSAQRPSRLQLIVSGASALPRPILYQPPDTPCFLRFRYEMMPVTTIMTISSRYQLRKPFPIVMRNTPSGSGSNPWPSCVING